MLEGCVKEGESQLGCKVSCRRFAPDCVPKPPPESERGPQNGSQNKPKSSKSGSLGESWGHLWPTWVPKRLLERQVGAKMGQVGATMSQDEVKLGPSWGPIGPSWGQDASRRGPKDAEWRSQGPFWNIFGPLGCKNAGLLEYPRFLHENSLSCNKGPEGSSGGFRGHFSAAATPQSGAAEAWRQPPEAWRQPPEAWRRPPEAWRRPQRPGGVQLYLFSPTNSSKLKTWADF